MRAGARVCRGSARLPWLLLCGALFSGCHEDLGIGRRQTEPLEVEEFTLSGVESVDESALRRVLATQPTPWWPWADPRYFDRTAFEQDLERIEAFYASHGYPDAEVVSYAIDTDDQANAVRLHVTVREGEPVVIESVSLVNFDALSESERSALRERLPAQPGEPLVEQELASSAERAGDALRNHGYPWAKVEVDRRVEGRRAKVVLRAEPGQLAFFGPIEVVGNTTVSDAVVRRQLLIRPGDLYRLEAIRASLRRLYALELFEVASIELAGEPRDGLEYPVRVVVTEGDHQRVDVSIGYGTEEKGYVEAQWRHVNFLGGARTLAVHGRASWRDRGVESALTQPYFFLPGTSLSLGGQWWFHDEPAFDTETRGARATVMRALGPNATATGHFGYERQRSQVSPAVLADPAARGELIALGLDPLTGVQQGTLATLGAATQLLRVDDPSDPTRGYFLGAEIEQAGGWLPGSYRYLKAIGEVRGYYTPHDRVTVAARLRYGGVDPFGPLSNIPYFKRFFLGGASSLRGWGRFEVSPLSAGGTPIGGTTLLESSVEVRTRVYGQLGIVAFLDAGNVWAEPWDLRLGNLLYDAGPGLRYLSPVGPMRLDLAFQINRLEGLRIGGQPQDRSWRVHFSIGHTF